jgi:serine/threonine protein phosphatase PrpC
VSTLTIRYGTATDTGLHRVSNEDSLFASRRCFVVADGMGGHAAGEVASALALRPFQTLDEQELISTEDLVTAAASANADILAEALSRSDRFGMGTTVSGLASAVGDDDPVWVVFNIGDSRVYRYADAVLTQITVDHSEVQELLDAGRLTPEQAQVYPRRNVVTRSLGSFPPPEIDVWELPMTAGERFLVCTDGLTNELDDEQIAQVLAESGSPADAAADLVRAANAAGGRDNTSVIVVDLS